MLKCTVDSEISLLPSLSRISGKLIFKMLDRIWYKEDTCFLDRTFNK